MILKLLLWLGAFCLFAGEAAATNVVLLSSGAPPPAFTISGGATVTLKNLGAQITANPSATITMTRDYNARKDGVYSTCPVTTTYLGAFSGGGHTVANLTIASASTATPAAKFGLFCQIGLTAQKTITAISQANPGSVTATAHGYTTGYKVWLSDIAGMTALNGQYVTITVTDGNHFTIGVDTTGYGAYTSGGHSQRIVGSVSNLTVSAANITLTGITTDGTILGQQVGPLAALNAGALTSVTCSGNTVTPSGGGNQDGGCIGQNQGHITNIACTNNSVIAGVYAFNIYQSNCISYELGVTDGTNTVTGGYAFTSSASSPYPTLGCNTPPCPAASAWYGPAVGAVGPNTNTGTTGVSSSGWTVTGTTIVGNTANISSNIVGGIWGNVLDATVTDGYSTVTITSCGNWCGGVYGNAQVAASVIRRVAWNGASITSSQNKVGAVGGQHFGTLDQFWGGNGTVTAGSGGNVGCVGTALTGSTITNGFCWGPMTSTGIGNGGNIGISQGTVDSVYSLGIISGTSNNGCVVGSDSNDAGITNAYFASDTCGSNRGAGNVVTPAGITTKTLAQLKAALPTGFSGTYWTRDGSGVIASGLPYLKNATVPPTYAAPPATEYHLLTDTGNFTVTAQCATGRNTIQAIGPGGNGFAGTTATGSRGGGGACWGQISNLVMVQGASIAYVNGAGGSGTSAQFKDGSTLVAPAGGNASSGSNGAACNQNTVVGTNHASGGGGGAGATAGGSGAGGGAGGPNGVGTSGAGAGGTNGTAAGGGGAGASDGGGTNSGGTNSTAGTVSGAGNGATAQDASAGGTGSAANNAVGGDGTNGSGPGGGFASGLLCSLGGAASYSQAWVNGGGFGPGSGAAGVGGLSTTTTACAGMTGGGYGGGGSGGGRGATAGGAAGAGAPSAILLTCSP